MGMCESLWRSQSGQVNGRQETREPLIAHGRRGRPLSWPGVEEAPSSRIHLETGCRLAIECGAVPEKLTLCKRNEFGRAERGDDASP